MAALETRHPALLRANQTALLVVDVQEAFRPAIDRFDEMVAQLPHPDRGLPDPRCADHRQRAVPEGPRSHGQPS